MKIVYYANMLSEHIAEHRREIEVCIRSIGIGNDVPILILPMQGSNCVDVIEVNNDEMFTNFISEKCERALASRCYISEETIYARWGKRE